ncbi:MAG TPA: flagellar hook-associated protein FlgL [Peptococcaceae bacterium]|nr:flagellar hook-associated protein FlgL [Peptococcaceae bacterium]
MRVTNNMLIQNFLKNLEMANNRMDLMQNRLTTGQAITAPSDDPVKIEISLRFKSNIAAMEQWQTNASEALAILETTEGILANMTAMLQRVRELTVQGANGSNSLDDRRQIANEVDQLTQQFRFLANSQVGTRYIFSGTLVDTPPMPEMDKWNGNSDEFKIEVGSNLTIPVSVNGAKLFWDPLEFKSPDGTEIEVSFFKNLLNLKTSLENGDDDGINKALAGIDAHLDNLLEARAELGAKTNRVNVIAEQLTNTIINLKQNLSDIQDADLAETIMEFQSIQNIYRAALAVGAQIIQPSLVDFMR